MNAVLRGVISLVVITAVFTGVVVFLFPAPCKKPISYSIGELDPRFGLSKDAFLKDIEQAERMWERQASKELFTYNASSTFTINLKYDERQATTDKAKRITQSLENTSQTRESLLKQYESAHSAYSVASQLYDQHRIEFDASATAFREKVEQYNKSGGAPEDEYKKLQDEQQNLNDRYTALEQERIHLNSLAAQVNKLADTESGIVATYNQTVQSFNDEFAGQREFDQGEYTGNAITIYEFTKNNDLVLVLTHELGHALGIGHVLDPQAVMYFMVNKKNVHAKGLAADDIDALRAQCTKSSFLVFWDRLIGLDGGYIMHTLSNL